MANSDRTQINDGSRTAVEPRDATRSQSLTREGAPVGVESRNPLTFVRRMMEDMDRLFTDFGFGASVAPVGREEMGAWVPPLEVFESDGNLVVRADLPGVKPEHVNLDLRGDMLVISGERKDERREEREGRRHKETTYGRFERAVRVPPSVDPSSCEASFNHGVLEVKLKLPEQQKPRSIPIKPGASKGKAS